MTDCPAEVTDCPLDKTRVFTSVVPVTTTYHVEHKPVEVHVVTDGHPEKTTTTKSTSTTTITKTVYRAPTAAPSDGSPAKPSDSPAGTGSDATPHPGPRHGANPGSDSSPHGSKPDFPDSTVSDATSGTSEGDSYHPKFKDDFAGVCKEMVRICGPYLN